MEQILTVRDAHHRYGHTVALTAADLEVSRGECVALLGPNGAGKTTLVGLVTGLLRLQQGQVEVVGGDPRYASVRRRLGVVQQSIGFPRTLQVGELVRGAAVRAGVPANAAHAVLAEVGISELAPRRAGKLSGGQQQRVQLAMALVADPDLLVLDEPTAGLDVAARRRFWTTIAARRDRGIGVLLTTHLVEETAAVADRVAVLSNGRILVTATPHTLTDLLPDRTVTARTRLGDDVLRRLLGSTRLHREGDLVTFATARPEPLVAALLAADPELTGLRVEGATLEQALMHLTGQTDAAEVAA